MYGICSVARRSHLPSLTAIHVGTLECLVIALISGFLSFAGIARLPWKGNFLILAMVSFLGGAFYKRYYVV